MSEQGRRSYKIGIITLLITLVLWVLLGVAIRAGWIDDSELPSSPGYGTESKKVQLKWQHHD